MLDDMVPITVLRDMLERLERQPCSPPVSPEKPRAAAPATAPEAMRLGLPRRSAMPQPPEGERNWKPHVTAEAAKRARGGGPRVLTCDVCGTRETPCWRRINPDAPARNHWYVLCNRCGIGLRARGRDRASLRARARGEWPAAADSPSPPKRARAE